PCCCRTASREPRCARISCWLPGWPSNGRESWHPASAWRTSSPVASATCHPACPRRMNGGLRPRDDSGCSGSRAAAGTRGRGLPVDAVAGRADGAQGDGAHAGPARADVRRWFPRLGAADRRRGEVRQKEHVVPTLADRTVFSIAPAVALVPYLLVLLVIPVGPGWAALNVDIGLFFALAVLSLAVLGSIMAGWSSANKYALLGGLRTAAQLMAYELPLVLAASSVAMAAGTLSMTGIVVAWRPWWLLWQAP